MGKPKLRTVLGKQLLSPILLVLPIVLLMFLNFLLVFTPEMGFDALWYHLTLPKLWLFKHQWYFPGGLLYYSVMPRLVETLYIPLIHFTGTIGPKLVQYLAGIGTGYVIWKILTHFKQSTLMRLSGVSLFYCTWLVSWQSGSAYIDLVRTFLESLALCFLIRGSWKIGGLFLGLAIGTKLLALGSLAAYSLIFGAHIIFPAMLVALPWFFIALHFTGNPVYPIFSGVLNNSFSDIGNILKHIVFSPIYLTRPFDDFISPLVGVLFLISLFALTKFTKPFRQIALVGVVGSLIALTLDPPSSRFVLPYLPTLVVSSILFVSQLKSKLPKKLLVLSVILSGFFILALRLYAMKKYLPLFMRQLDSRSFLVSQASRLPGTFLDADGYVGGLPEGSKILVDKLHNLYYFPRDFDHTSWVTEKSGYDYLVTIGESPEKVSGSLIHTNSLGIQIFKLNP
ncbi:MAG: hypothetical protein UW68_C0001G0039 [Candidatus Collierbacteria bacterium GW2011_GWB1_44_6]|uniref:Glycosyltransferase RgtA/B/C/D-like domain-containing protein n=2 Tax=Candidatus Collieribacteriota TaxID=1752725 RepID=A0A0G1JR77_9BACT|nr:MAG: hypothetical protein UV68_C0001G0011 [Candidatus Collierbacteria bacterium GW2011_GWC2_43_12]KKT73843.1 MAG: hypothetical protein UW68_C0001G0039 [Candidatus Collierbacteria bacterium GW2011_GWB1_44_6]KKT84131.1 MAG: hypothetical protein UW80_C0001G0011 [Microgenomates group bacterium GW2011_GWC1_44_9]